MNPQNQTTSDSSQLPPIPGQGDALMPVASSPSDKVPQDLNSMPQQPVSQPIPPIPSSQGAPKATKSPHAPSIADDNDLIEKEWVNKAKLIVAKTKDDPREQSKELYKYKADYIKKRYNKDIKVSEV